MKFLLTSRFSQDFVEIFFSLVRLRQVVPTALQFKNNLKLICVSQYLKVPKGSYDIDDREFLSGFLDLFKNVQKPTNKITLPNDWDKDQKNLSIAELNCLYSIVGYIASSLKKSHSICSSCLPHVASYEPITSKFASLVNLKQYAKHSCLLYVREDIFLNFIFPMECSFRQLEPFLLSSKENCIPFLKEKFNNLVKSIDLPT